VQENQTQLLLQPEKQSTHKHKIIKGTHDINSSFSKKKSQNQYQLPESGLRFGEEGLHLTASCCWSGKGGARRTENIGNSMKKYR
jgi:hypothetical protein